MKTKKVVNIDKIITFKRANVDTPPATRKVQRYSGTVYLIP